VTYLAVLAVTAIALLCGGREEQREEAGVGAGNFTIGNEVSGVSAAEHDGTSVLASLRVVPMLRQHRPAADRNPSASCMAPEPWALQNTPHGAAVDWPDDASLSRDAGRAAHQPRAPPHAA
jgi:hypothetical protein